MAGLWSFRAGKFGAQVRRQHRLSNLDVELLRADCSVCGPVKVRRKGLRANGSRQYRCVASDNATKRLAHHAPRKKYPKTERQRAWQKANRPLPPWRHHLQPACGRCGFEGESCQMDVHHRDGDRTNNDPRNLMTLCANCHRLAHRGGWHTVEAWAGPLPPVAVEDAIAA